MTVGKARAAAIEWVERNAARWADFRGAYFIGSTVGLPDDAELPRGSDLDVVIATTDESRPEPGKVLRGDALVQITLLPWRVLSVADDVLANYHLANGLRFDTVIADPTGDLRAVQRDVARRFADEEWVRRRCRNAKEKIETYLKSVDRAAPWPDQVISWLFGTGITTHVLLTAAMRNPTVRLRYVAVRTVLDQYGLLDRHEELLRLLGCAELAPQRVEAHVANLAGAFDAAAAVARTPFPFGSDITPPARPTAVDSILELIRSGSHREVVFWIVATFARCMKILAVDASPDERRTFRAPFDELLADLGIRSTEDLLARADSVLGYLPRLWETAESIIAANSDIAKR